MLSLAKSGNERSKPGEIDTNGLQQTKILREILDPKGGTLSNEFGCKKRMKK